MPIKKIYIEITTSKILRILVSDRKQEIQKGIIGNGTKQTLIGLSNTGEPPRCSDVLPCKGQAATCSLEKLSQLTSSPESLNPELLHRDGGGACISIIFTNVS